MPESLAVRADQVRDLEQSGLPHAGLRRRALVAALAILALAALTLRLVGSNWDDGAHLHPDERYISTVADNTSLPSGLGAYLRVESSPLSPYNIEQGRDYIYGQLPLTATKLVAAVLGKDGYGELNVVGRRLAAVLDALTCLLVFAITYHLLAGTRPRPAVVGGVLAALLYAFTVTAIQHAHFFTTDVWAVMFSMLTFWLALRALRTDSGPGSRGSSVEWILVGAALGLTVACKVSAALVAIPVALALVGRMILVGQWAGMRAAALRLVATGGLSLLSAYVAFRLASPYIFERSNWLNVSVNDSFRTALETQARAVAGPSALPPSYQWQLSSPIWSPLENLATWQTGLPLALAALAGLGVLCVRLVRDARSWLSLRSRVSSETVVALTSNAMVISFVATVFAYFATRFVHSGRYLLPLVPLLSVAAALAVVAVAARWKRLGIALGTVVAGGTALYALAFMHIYTQTNTRVEASAWIGANVAPGSSIANEHWDDALPIGGPWGATREEAQALRGFQGVEVAVYHPDDERKIRDLYDALSSADYYVLSSPRAWNTIGRLDAVFPLMPRFYDQLFAGHLGFERVASFTSYPELLGVEIDDLRAEEAFWVYDHPPVSVFRRERPLRFEDFKAALCPEPVAPHCA